jgi:hypothetical protein
MRGGFLGQPTSGGATQREKDSSPAGRFCVIAAVVFARFDSIAFSPTASQYIDSIYRNKMLEADRTLAKMRANSGPRQSCAQSLEL